MLQRKKSYKHIFFDLDHTLWDFETNARETMRYLYALNNLEQKGIDSFDVFFKHYVHHNENLWSKYTKGQIRQEELRWKRLWLSILEFKLNDEALAKKMSAEFLERLPLQKALFPHTVEILTYLKGKGYVLHLITNGFEAVQFSKLSNSGLTDFFVEIITSERANSLKPNREIFEFALQEAHATLEESIMIGDNLDADIKGAMDAGLDTIFVNHLKMPVPKEPTYVIHHLQELEEIF